MHTLFFRPGRCGTPGAADSDATAAVGDLPHAVESMDDRSVGWRSVTRGNLSMRHDTTQGMSLQLRAPLNARLTLDVNNERIEHRLDELLRCARAHFLNGWLSEAMRIDPLIPIEECAVHATVVTIQNLIPMSIDFTSRNATDSGFD